MCMSCYWTKHEKNIYFNKNYACQNSRTELFGSNGSTSKLCPWYAGCDLVGILASLTKAIVIFFILYKQLPEYCLKVGHDHLFRNNSNSLFTAHPNARRYVNWDDDSAINKQATRALSLLKLYWIFEPFPVR